MRAVAVATLFMCCTLAACAPMSTQDPGVAKCDTAKIDWAKGQPATEENARRMVRESGLGLWRIIGPNDIEKKDYRPDRLTIYTDKANIIQSMSCH